MVADHRQVRPRRRLLGEAAEEAQEVAHDAAADHVSQLQHEIHALLVGGVNQIAVIFQQNAAAADVKINVKMNNPTD